MSAPQGSAISAMPLGAPGPDLVLKHPYLARIALARSLRDGIIAPLVKTKGFNIGSKIGRYSLTRSQGQEADQGEFKQGQTDGVNPQLYTLTRDLLLGGVV